MQTGNKKQSTVASSSPTADEPAVAESEGDASYPIQERQQDQEYVDAHMRGSCMD